MLLKKYKLKVKVAVRFPDWDKKIVNFKRYKSYPGDCNICNVCKFWNHISDRCEYDTELTCEFLDTDNYSYIPC